MSAETDKPAGWHEPIHDAVAYPASFFGARPRNLMLAIYAVAMLMMVMFSMRSQLLSALLTLAGTLFVHLLLIVLSYPRVEPFWAEVLGDWYETPSNRIDP